MRKTGHEPPLALRNAILPFFFGPEDDAAIGAARRPLTRAMTTIAVTSRAAVLRRFMCPGDTTPPKEHREVPNESPKVPALGRVSPPWYGRVVTRDGIEFRILGPLEVEQDGRLLALGGPKQRAVLAGLLLHVNRVVSRDGLIEIVWGERPPETAAAALQGYVAALRKALGPDSIVTRPPGYVLEAAPGAVDLGRFETLVQRGKEELAAGDAESASARLTAALGLWRGEPLADLDPGPTVTIERLRLEELRLGATEERIEADLAQGRHGELIAELQTLVREHPLRERLCGQLMLALYRSGRQAEALDVYQQARRRLAEELGLEPGDALKRLERAILEQDPALGPVAQPPSTRSARPRRRPQARWLALGLVVLVGTSIGLTIAATSGSGGSFVRPNSIAVIDPATNKLVDDVLVGKRPAAVAVGEGGVWVANADNRTVSRIDPKTRKVVDIIGIGSDVDDVAVGVGSVWVAGGTDGTVSRIDPKVDKVVASVRVGLGPVFWIASGAGGVWAISGQSLVRINPETGRVAATFPLFTQPTGLTAGLGAVWVTTQDGSLLAISRRGDIKPMPRPFSASVLAPAVGAGAIWVIVYLGRSVIQPVDPVSLELSPGTETSAFPLDVTVGRTSVWAVDVHGTVLRIDPTTADVVARIATAPTARSAIAVGAGAVWVAIQQPS
jgi:DNA-binding SARP family transcriptional activator